MKSFFLKYELGLVLISLALLSVLMPILISAASTTLFISGIAIGAMYLTWVATYAARLLSNESFNSNDEVL